MLPRQKKAIGYWQPKAMEARRVRLYQEMQGGDVESAKKLLATTLGVLAKVINGEEVDVADVVVLDYIRTAIVGILDGQSMELAFGIEKKQGGRPKRVFYDDLQICGMVKKEVEKLENDGYGAPVRIAQESVARQMKISARKVRGIWNKSSKTKTPME